MPSNPLVHSFSDLDLINHIQSNSPFASQAKTILLSRYNHLILKSIKPYLKLYEYKELFQIAVQGFLTSLNKFDTSRGKSIGVYAHFYLMNLICKYVKNSIKHEKNQCKKFSEDKNDFIFPESINDNTSLDDEVDASILKSEVERFRSKLTAQENKLIEYVFYQGKTLSESAKLMNVCKQRTSHIFRNIKEKGRKFFKYYKLTEPYMA